jgi:hypothetical protein
MLGPPWCWLNTLDYEREPVSIACVFRHRNAAIAAALLPLLGGQGASAQTCFVNAPQYRLSGDTVSWEMTVSEDRSCIKGVRFAKFQFDGLALISLPRFGKVELLGAGFRYSPKAEFRGKDSFSLRVDGVVDGKRGSSTIEVIVSIGASNGSDTATRSTPSSSRNSTNSRDTSPPSVSVLTPSDGSITSGSRVALKATAADNVAVAKVQFIVAGSKIGSAITSPPYETVWDSTTVADGAYTLYAVAQDTSGNYWTSSVHFTVRNSANK